MYWEGRRNLQLQNNIRVRGSWLSRLGGVDSGRHIEANPNIEKAIWLATAIYEALLIVCGAWWGIGAY